MSVGDALSYDLKTLPRPKGSATQVIVTGSIFPRKTIEPHDVILDAEGRLVFQFR